MHELSIALGIVDFAQEEAARLGGKVTAVHLRLGRLSGVVSEALLSGYEVACQDTVLEGSTLVIEDVPVVVYCPACREQRSIEGIQWFVCPECGTPTPEVRSGKELTVVALEVE
jgi:hydrogenase nickel incorporation protein HypA/HybF